MHAVDELVVLLGRAALELEIPPAAIEEVGGQPAVGGRVDRVDGRVAHQVLLSFDQVLELGQRVVELGRPEGEPPLLREQSLAQLFGRSLEQCADLAER